LQTAIKRLGRYELRKPIGSGGIGTVFEGFDIETGEAAAIKLFRPLSSDSEAVGRFLSVQARLRELHHQRLVRVLDYGLDRDQPWVAMEPAAGSLRPFADVPLSIQSALRVAIQAAEGLQAIHNIGILHGNLKLSNLLLDAQGNVVVSDVSTDILGLGVGEGYRAVQTTPSPVYMSPEQGRLAPTDGRSDVYSLGILLFELLTGEVPYSGYDASTVLVKQELEALTPPSRINAEVQPSESHRESSSSRSRATIRLQLPSANLRALYPGPVDCRHAEEPDEARRRRIDEGLQVCPHLWFWQPARRSLCLAAGRRSYEEIITASRTAAG
jgi:serine/threonine protein kinase